jgi:predicted O-methyltransferase YrrM
VSVTRRDELLSLAEQAKGFMPRDEGLALYSHALELGERIPSSTWLEVGAWCGKSALYLGAAAEATKSVLLNTLPTWQRTIGDAHLEETVIGLVGHSAVVARHFTQPLELLFIDGGHAHDVAWSDYRAWSPKVVVGGVLLIHDVFPTPEDGGRPPYEIYLAALESDAFVDVANEGSLRALRRVR